MRLLPLYAVYLITFGLAAYTKIAAGGVPEWFIKQFSGTFLNLFPGALAVNFYFLALLETFVLIGLLVSLVKGEFRRESRRTWLCGSLYLAQVVFIILGFGMRLTGNFTVAFELFGYFAITYFALRTVQEEPTRRS